MPRDDHEPPLAIARLGWRYHHLGIPTNVRRPNEVYLAHAKMYVSGFDTGPYGIEWMRFEPDSPVSELVRSVPHIAFEVDDLEAALEGKERLGEVTSPSAGVRGAMIVDDGAPIELLELQKVGQAGDGSATGLRGQPRTQHDASQGVSTNTCTFHEEASP